jgi:peptidyl-prolyl cis-trans isomerase C
MRRIDSGAARGLRAAVLGVLTTTCALPLLGQALGPTEADAGGRVIARVNGEELYAEDLRSVLEEIHRSQEVERRSNYDLDQMMFRLVNDTLLAQEARALDFDEAPEVRGRIERRRESLARTRFYREAIVDRLVLDEEAARKVYDDVFRTPTLRIISRRDRAELEALRPEVLAARDDESFAKLAREKSQDSYALREGRIEAPLTDLFKSLYEHAATAAVGELSAPLAVPWGWSYVRLEKLAPADPEKFAERRSRTLVELRHRQEHDLRVALVERLRPELGLQIDWDVYESIGVQRMHDGKLLPQFEGPERAVATLAGRTITAKDLAGKLANAWSSVGNPEIARQFKPGVLDDLIFEEMLIAEGLRRGYGDTPEAKRTLHALEMSQLSQRYLKETVAAGIEVTPQEMRDYYDRHREAFRKPPRLHLLQITVATEEEAQRIAGLAKGGADFGWLARQHSVDKYRDAGGDRGWILATEGIVNFRTELAGAQAGDVFGPKLGPQGWVVVKVDLFEAQGYYEFDAVSGNVRSRLTNEKIVARIDQVVQTLRERSEIWIDEQALAEIRLLPTAPEEKPVVVGHDGR